MAAESKNGFLWRDCVDCVGPRVCVRGARVCVRVYVGVLVSAELEARIFELEMNLANAQLERDQAYRTLELDTQTRERHALQVIADIANSAANGAEVPTLETVRVLFGEWANRQTWNKSQAGAIASALDAVDDIIAGRIRSGRKSAAEVIAELER